MLHSFISSLRRARIYGQNMQSPRSVEKEQRFLCSLWCRPWWKLAVPIEDNIDAEISLQPVEEEPHATAGGCLRGGCYPMGDPWIEGLCCHAGAACPSRTESCARATHGTAVWGWLLPWDGLTLQQLLMRWTHIGEEHGKVSPVGGTPQGSRGMTLPEQQEKLREMN